VYQRTDVADDAQVRELVQRAVSEFGALDLAVNNAGLGAAPKPLQDVSDAEWQRTITVTLTGTSSRCAPSSRR